MLVSRLENQVGGAGVSQQIPSLIHLELFRKHNNNSILDKAVINN